MESLIEIIPQIGSAFSLAAFAFAAYTIIHSKSS